MNHQRLFAVIALTLATSPAFGADLPIRALPMAAAPVTWQGFYLGADGGYAFDAPIKFSIPDLRGDVAKLNPRSASFGGHAGYNWQAGSFVFGVELFAAWNGASKTQDVGEGLATINTKIDYFGSATARAGLAILNDTVLVYGRAGIGFAHTTATLAVAPPVIELPVPALAVSLSETAQAFNVSYGPVLGAGLEWRIFGSPDWLLRVDWQHYMLGNNSFAFAGTASGNVNASINLDVVTLGVSRKF